MKVINYDFENVGGLLQVIAVSPTSFLRIRKDYNAGLNYLELRDRENIISIPVYANDTYVYNEDKEVNVKDVPFRSETERPLVLFVANNINASSCPHQWTWPLSSTANTYHKPRSRVSIN